MGGYATSGGARLLAATVLTLAALAALPGMGMARVGVTSGADGDPLGKPPNENERILRIGIDVQANELITTQANDRAHLVFIDGSSLTVGPNARLTIDKFVYDPNAQRGELAINASKGVLRLVGGKISKNTPITITTPASTIGIRGGITIVSVTNDQTVANFVFGNSMTVTAGNQTQTATRAGSAIATKVGGVPGIAVLVKAGALTAALSQLEGTNSSSNNSADQTAQSSGFSSKNSGQPANSPLLPNGPPNPSNNTLTNAVSNSNPASNPAGNNTVQNQQTTLTVSTDNTNTKPNLTLNPNPTANPTPNPTTKTNQTLTGFSSGLVVISRGSFSGSWPSEGYEPAHKLEGTISLTTNAANNQAQATMTVGISGFEDPVTATLQLGGARASVFTDDKNYVMGTQTTDPTRVSMVQVGSNTPQPLNDTTVLVSVPNNGNCKCEFLTWGLWASTGPDPGHNNNNYLAYGSYVAGRTPTVALPQTGTATYSGFMAGVAQTGNSTPQLASGTFQNAWNFTSRTGVFSANFDNRAYSGNTAATGGTTFNGTFSGNGGHSGSLNGAFFASPTDAAAYQAGTFSIQGSGYRAGGVFAGQR